MAERGWTILSASRIRILEEAGWRLGTDVENEAAMRFRWAGYCPHQIRQQYQVGPYRLDFAFVALMLDIEIDGWQHDRPETAAKDALRDRKLRSEGWIVLRVNAPSTDSDELRQGMRRVLDVIFALEDAGALQLSKEHCEMCAKQGWARVLEGSGTKTRRR